MIERKLTGKIARERIRLMETPRPEPPLGRYARPDEVASERASYVTGALVTMDGALTPLVV